MSAGTTTGVVKEARYVLTNIEGNNNKFWNLSLLSDGTAEAHWGRIGETGQKKLFKGFDDGQFDVRCTQKERGGYRTAKTLANTAAGGGLSGERLARVATEQIRSDSAETAALIAKLARANVHRILEATSLTYDESRGTFSTPLGILTADALYDARAILTRMGNRLDWGTWGDADSIVDLNEYLMLVPRNVGRARLEPKTLFPDLAALQQESSLLDSLEASLQCVLSAASEDQKAVPPPQLFEAKLTRVNNLLTVERIRRKYRSTQQAMHACAHLDVKRVFSVEIGGMARAFQGDGKRVGNVKELWHGTRAANLLSILKSGFQIPAASAPHVCGRMFGNGVYFSDQSTKSLNYAYGWWQGKVEETCYMFLCDVALGKCYSPKLWNPNEALPKPGADSTFARAGLSGVANNEMIVYRTEQILPRFLVEFSK